MRLATTLLRMVIDFSLASDSDCSACTSVGAVEEAAARLVLFEGADDGGATGGLHGDHLGAPRADPAELLHFIEGLPHADHADAAAGGIEDGVGQFPTHLFGMWKAFDE